MLPCLPTGRVLCDTDVLKVEDAVARISDPLEFGAVNASSCMDFDLVSDRAISRNSRLPTGTIGKLDAVTTTGDGKEGNMVEVVVVGAGPGGSAAAKRCAGNGLETLVLEKKRFPRDKVCSGMLMGSTTQGLICQEYGPIPNSVFGQPRSLKGYKFHVPGVGSRGLDHVTPLTWRRNLDFWMSRQAEAQGAVIWQGARVSRILHRGDRYLLRVESEGEVGEIEARFVVGADGAVSAIRRSLFPDLKVRYGQIYQACYQGDVDLDKEYFHWFYPRQFSPAFFTFHRKDGLVVMDFSGPPGAVKSLRSWGEDFLSKEFGLRVAREPLWRGGCLEPILYRPLIDRKFSAGDGNVLLVGDAAGLLLPVSGEGVGCAIRSGIMAAESIQEAIRTGAKAAPIYHERLAPLLAHFAGLAPWFKRIREVSGSGIESLPQVLAEAYAETLRPY